MGFWDTGIKGLTIVTDTTHVGDYSATYKHFGLEFHALYVNAEIRIHAGGAYKIPAWKTNAAVKAVRTHFAKTIESFPPAWHAAHAAIYAEGE